MSLKHRAPISAEKLNLPTFWQLDSFTVKSFCAHRDDETSSTEKLQMHGGKKTRNETVYQRIDHLPILSPQQVFSCQACVVFFWCVGAYVIFFRRW